MSPTYNYKAGDSCTRTNGGNSVCNFSGVLNDNFYQYGSSLYPGVDQDTAARCAAICRTRKDCMGSTSIGGSCYFTDQTMTPSSFRQMQGISHLWDDPSCWDCPGCHTQVGVILLYRLFQFQVFYPSSTNICPNGRLVCREISFFRESKFRCIRSSVDL